MKKREVKAQSDYYYNAEGTQEVSEQIMDSYNSGVIDHPEARFDSAAMDGLETIE